MDLEILKALISAAIPIAVAVLTAGFAYHRYLGEQKNKKEVIVRTVFGDLANIYTSTILMLTKNFLSTRKIKMRFSAVSGGHNLEK